MVSTPSTENSTDSRVLPERRVTLYSISWDAYEQILAALGNDRAAQLTYFEETLEIMTPLEEHENSSDLIGDFIKILVEENNLNIKSLRSTTLKRSDLAVGAEPDNCYYIANEPAVRGKTVDLTTDPPPDLVVEVDITHTDINKTELYAKLGVPEFWRYDGRLWQIYQLHANRYKEVSTSPTFPQVPKQRLYQFLRECAQQGENSAKRNLRQWIREQLNDRENL
ncbi:MAG: Uma2 family endonuclease [Leptolyngbyaceae cyanobacterium SL_7_1]|nr:Uma2 family endonuclease [Leptolyngbyaceae cyanobacterium SL_7_1]